MAQIMDGQLEGTLFNMEYAQRFEAWTEEVEKASEQPTAARDMAIAARDASRALQAMNAQVSKHVLRADGCLLL